MEDGARTAGSAARPSGSDPQREALYRQLAQNAARLLVVHEANDILRSTQDPERLASGLLDIIAEALFADAGCVAAIDGDDLDVLATRGFSESEVDALVAAESEARIWFLVADGTALLTRAEVVKALAGDARPADEDPPDAIEETTENPELTETEEEQEEPEEALGEKEEEQEESEAQEEEEAATAGSQESARPGFEVYVPLRVEDRVLGVLALGRRIDSQPYAPEDLELADSLAGHLALALSSARLLADKAQRIEQLSVLLRISKQITSTLDLDRVLVTIAQMTALVVPNRRAAVALVTASDVHLRATSDPAFDPKRARDDPLLPVLRWVSAARQRVNTAQADLEDHPSADGRDVLLPYLSRDGGPRGLAVLPLEDDQGMLGLLAIESDRDAPPLDAEAEELVTILANQTTVAARNAELYQRIPMLGALQPLLGKARQAGRAGARKWRVRAVVALGVLAIGLFVPVPTWVAGDATLRPALPVPLRAATEGTVEEVLVVEGQEVAAGTVVARLRTDELQLKLEQARAAEERASAEAADACRAGEPAIYRARQAEIDELRREQQFLGTEIGRTDLVAPSAGVVLTSRVELRRGAHLMRGATFLELADLSSMEVEVAVPEEDIGGVRPGLGARLKVHAYPARSFRGQVTRIAPRAEEGRVFRVAIRIDNRDGALRPGMTGRAHLTIAPRPFLRTWLRPALRGLRFKFWW